MDSECGWHGGIWKPYYWVACRTSQPNAIVKTGQCEHVFGIVATGKKSLSEFAWCFTVGVEDTAFFLAICKWHLSRNSVGFNVSCLRITTLLSRLPFRITAALYHGNPVNPVTLLPGLDQNVHKEGQLALPGFVGSFVQLTSHVFNEKCSQQRKFQTTRYIHAVHEM